MHRAERATPFELPSTGGDVIYGQGGSVMCGIFAIATAGGHGRVPQALDTLLHRGPDGSGMWANPSRQVALGSTRLAVRDLSPLGHMPMANEDESVVITYNGEIYNHAELRLMLEAKGSQFKSTSDTEVVLRAYEKFGRDCVRHLDGMFAFAIWDAKREEFFVARDHFGVKPFYYFQQGERFVCASEVKALLTVPWVTAAVNVTALHQYLTFLWVPDPLTMFDGILKLEAGHCATFRNGTLEIEQYWNLDFPSAQHEYPRDESGLVAEFKELFTSAVDRQMVSDVPLGSFLSAGLDSSAIVATMAQLSSEPVRTFTISFPDEFQRSSVTFDDTAVAARTAASFGCRHTDIMVEPDVVDLLPKLIWHLDEPIADPAAITAFLVNREAKSTVTVLMSGVGGDELLAGYRKHSAHFRATAYRRIPSTLRHGAIEPLAERLPAMPGSRLADPIRFFKKMIRGASLSADDMFLMNSTYFPGSNLAQLVSPEHWRHMLPLDPWDRHRKHFNSVEGVDPLNRMLYVDTKAFMTSLNLTYNDKMSMANSTEVRVPFLDRHLAEFMAQQVPPSLKLHGHRRLTSKYLLRQAMAGVLPNEVLEQPKAGFGAPLNRWLQSDLAPMIGDLLSPDRINKRGWFQPLEVQRLLERQRTGRDDLSLQIWALLTFELWQQQFIDG